MNTFPFDSKVSNNKTVHKKRWEKTRFTHFRFPFSFSIFVLFYFSSLFFIVSANFCLLKLSSLICSIFFNFHATFLFGTLKFACLACGCSNLQKNTFKQKKFTCASFLVKSNYIDRSFCSGKQPFKLDFNFLILKIDRGWCRAYIHSPFKLEAFRWWQFNACFDVLCSLRYEPACAIN